MARAGQLADLPGPAERWLVNLRVSRWADCYAPSISWGRRAARGARHRRRARRGNELADARGTDGGERRGQALVAQEGAFGTHLLEHDVVEPPLMFGAGGILDAGVAAIGTAPGWGLAIREAP